MKIIVNPKNYTNCEYSPYLENGSPVKAPINPTYVVGQVVVVEHENRKDLAVVLGCIDEECDNELRLDLCGMTSIEKIRPANINDFGRKDIGYPEKLLKECQGYKVAYNWDTYELTVEEPKF